LGGFGVSTGNKTNLKSAGKNKASSTRTEKLSHRGQSFIRGLYGAQLLGDVCLAWDGPPFP